MDRTQEQLETKRVLAHDPAARRALAISSGLDPERIPAHIAIIMDGNGRWAEARGMPRLFGHRLGAAAVRRTVEAAGELGVRALTMYSFSTENWNRPEDEVRMLMQLCVAYCEGEKDALIREGIRFRVIGRREGLPDDVLAALDSVERATSHLDGPTLCLALNYSGRAEIVDAARALAHSVASGELDPGEIDDRMFASRLYAPDMPEPELLIRTGGEMRVSNFMLWQISYSEMVITDTLWPDFEREHLIGAIRAYQGRSRRFGSVVASEAES